MKDEHTYTVSAAGIKDEEKGQVEAVSSLMNAITSRMELGIKRIDAYAKWFAAMTTLLAALFAGYVAITTDKQLKVKNKKIDKLETRVGDQEKKINELNIELMKLQLPKSLNSDLRSLTELIQIMSVGSPRGVAVSSDGQMIALAGEGRTVLIRNANTTEEPVRLEGHESQVVSLSFSADARYMASGDSHGSVLIWDLDNPSDPVLVSKFSGHRDPIVGIDFSPDVEFLYLRFLDGTVRRWDMKNQRIHSEFQIPRF